MPKKKHPVFGQYNMLAEFDKDVPLSSKIIRRGDPRYDSAISVWLQSNRFGLDIETYALGGRDATNPWEGQIRLIQIAVENKNLGDFVLLWDLDEEKIEDELNLLELMLAEPGVFTVGHNLKFDLLYLRVKYGFQAVDVRDTMLLSQLIWAGVGLTMKGMLKHNLGAVAARYGLEADKTQQMSDWGANLTNGQLNYAANDALTVLKLIPMMAQDIEHHGLTYSAKAECEALPAFVEMEYHGMPVDEAKLDEILKEYEKARESVIQPFKKKFPMTNPNSSQKVLHVLAGTYGEAIKEAMIDGVNELESTDAPTLFMLAEEIPEAKEVFRSLYLYRSLGTQVAYLKGIKENVRHGRVRSDFRQCGPSGTGRSTSSNPNLQNPSNLKKSWRELGLPPIRDIFRAKPGYKFIISDLSGAHARIAAQASLDHSILAAYNGGADLHSITASGVAREEGHDWTHEEINKWRKDRRCKNHKEAARIRQYSKNVFYGCVPMDTQALTREGWKYAGELKVGEEILAYNPETQMNEWTPLLKVNLYQEAPIFKMSSGKESWSFECTMDHRWVGWSTKRIPGKYKEKGPNSFHKTHYYEEEIVRLGEMSRQFRIRVTAPAVDGPGLDWSTHQEANKYEVDWVQKVLEMTSSQRKMFLLGSLLGEGHVVNESKGAKGWVLTQKFGNIQEAMHLAAYLEGHKVSFSEGYDTARMRLCKKEVISNQKGEPEYVGLGAVWCPTTKFGTWVMRQKGQITITGNSLNMQSPETLQNTFNKEEVYVSVESCDRMIRAWQETYHDLHQYQWSIYHGIKDDNVQLFGNTYGRVRGLTGRRLYIEKYDGKFKLTEGVAFVWLSTEADIIKNALGRLYRLALSNPDWGIKICNFPHDEIDVEVMEEWAGMAAKSIQEIVRDCMGDIIKAIPAYDESESHEDLIVNTWTEGK